MKELIEFRENKVIITTFEDKELLLELATSIYKLKKLIGKDVHLRDFNNIDYIDEKIIKSKMYKYPNESIIFAIRDDELKYIEVELGLKEIIDESKKL